MARHCGNGGLPFGYVMLADLLGEVVTSIVGETIIGLLFPGVSKPKSSPPEGEWNASLGPHAIPRRTSLGRGHGVACCLTSACSRPRPLR
jgi:hypothetical protein